MVCDSCRQYIDCSLIGSLSSEEDQCESYGLNEQKNPNSLFLLEATRQMNTIRTQFQQEKVAFFSIEFSSSHLPDPLHTNERLWKSLARIYRWEYRFTPHESVTFFNPLYHRID